MQYKPLGNAVAVVLASVVGLSITASIKPLQAETSDDAMSEVTANVSAESDSAAQSETEVSLDVVKVGESSSQQQVKVAEETIPAIAKVFPHVADDRQAATVYVRNIPVLTFLGDAVQAEKAEQDSTELRKLAATKVAPPDVDQPLWKANKLVAEFNQLNRTGKANGEEISVRWEDDLYIIEHGEDVLVTLDEDAILPDTTGASAEDALQATNRLRRLLGQEEASALTEVADLPAPPEPEPQVVAYGGSFYEQGEASWYGPGFHGNLTANGERYNQWAMTAAHKYLPFGTVVRVTNLYSGAAAVVRINDRGPYAHGRVIDLSAAAADVIGMDGVASVRIDILN